MNTIAVMSCVTAATLLTSRYLRFLSFRMEVIRVPNELSEKQMQTTSP